MKATFYIDYHTRPGEAVELVGIGPLPMSMGTRDGHRWEVETDLDLPLEARTLDYGYRIVRGEQVARTEHDRLQRRLQLAGNARKHLYVYDQWRDGAEQPMLYTSAFTHAWAMRRPVQRMQQGDKQAAVVFKALAVRGNERWRLMVSGSAEELGKWHPRWALPMYHSADDEWTAVWDAMPQRGAVEYKYILYNAETDETIWEEGPNRRLDARPADGEQAVACGVPRFSLPPWRAAGVCVPVFALRSAESWGIGDFGDLKRMVDWAASVGLRVVQLLPVNDTTASHTWADSYPYNALSVFALNPLYADLNSLRPVTDKARLCDFEQQRQRLNRAPRIDYEAVDKLKWEYLRLAYDKGGHLLLDTPGCREFVRQNSGWLRPYAAFCCWRDEYGTADFARWPAHARYKEAEVAALLRPGSPGYDRAAFYIYVQYLLHSQLSEAAQYARARGVVLKGDIPIGVSRRGVEPWQWPELFCTDRSAGAPPDAFAVQGQNWGFPVYNWPRMAQDGFAWWKARLRVMSRYFDAYRIDHVLGFFRIWSIPAEVRSGLTGQFDPALPLSAAEMEAQGFRFSADMAKPYADEQTLQPPFNTDEGWHVQPLLLPVGKGKGWRLRAGYDTPHGVAARLADPADEAARQARHGLLRLLDEVLFVRDHRLPDRYHPRIDGMQTAAYRALSTEQQQAYRRLHEDYFYRRNDALWEQQALLKLPALIHATGMLACGEDLGMIPACVPGVLRKLHILSLEVQRMPKQYGQEFALPADYPYESVSTIGTHDMGTLRQWWAEDEARAARFYRDVLHGTGQPPGDASPDLCRQVVQQHLDGTSMLCILSLQDWLSMDGDLRNPCADEEQINVPADPHHHWQYRMHLYIEQLQRARQFNDRLRDMLRSSNRMPEL